MKKAFQLCDSCNLQPSCPTGVALDSFESGREVEIRTCKSYVQRSINAPTVIEAEEGET